MWSILLAWDDSWKDARLQKPAPSLSFLSLCCSSKLRAHMHLTNTGRSTRAALHGSRTVPSSMHCRMGAPVEHLCTAGAALLACGFFSRPFSDALAAVAAATCAQVQGTRLASSSTHRLTGRPCQAPLRSLACQLPLLRCLGCSLGLLGRLRFRCPLHTGACASLLCSRT